MEGLKLHLFSVDCERRSIPFLPFKRTEKDAQGNESKKVRLEGGGGSNKEEKRTQCNSCGKYHLGICDPTRGKSSSSSSSSKTKFSEFENENVEFGWN